MTTTRHCKRRFSSGFLGPVLCAWVLSFLFSTDSARAVITPAGSQVVGQSVGQYRVGATQLSANSNAVTTVVLPLYSIVVNPPGSVASPAFVVQGYEGDTLYVTFSLGNLGNAPDSVSLSNAVLPPSTIGLGQVIFFNDVNVNGRFDTGEDDPSFLALASGVTTTLSVALVLAVGQGSGDTYAEIRATSVNDPPAFGASVVHVMTLPPLPGGLHMGPYQNAFALPGGEGSGDDVMTRQVGYADVGVVFRNDITNMGSAVDIVQVEIADTTGWPSGISIAFQDTTGAPFPTSPLNPAAALLGAFNAGETRSLLAYVSTSGPPFSSLVSDSLSMRIRARSLVDTLRTNETTDRISAPSSVNAASVISLQQTFTSNVAAFGDVVTLVVTVTNLTDSVQVDGIVVSEDMDAVLNFLSSPGFSPNGQSVVWNVGTLQPRQARETVLKLVTNSRVTEGEAKVSGRADGVAITGTPVLAGPIVNVLQIQNDVFSDKGVVLGDVFVDANANRTRDPGEKGLHGIAVYLESGEFAVSDSLGKFAIPNTFSGYRVVRIDESTLPPDVDWTSERDDRTLTERIVHLLPSGHATVSFALRGKPPIAPSTVSRSIVCQELVSVQKRTRVIYQIPAITSSHFPTGESYLKTGSLEQLDPIVTYLSANPDWIVLIEGHTDSIPIHTAEFPSNEELSVARASAVMRYLTAHGIGREQIIVRGYGDRKPVATNATTEGRMANRRVEIGFLRSDMRDEDELSMERIRAVLEELETRPDSVDVRLLWDISTDSPDSFDVDLSVSLPAAMRVQGVSVRRGDENLPVRADSLLLQGFTRSRGFRCEVRGLVADGDTAFIRDVAPTLAFVHRGPSKLPKRSVSLRPLANGNGPGETHAFSLATWQDIVRTDAATEPDTGVTQVDSTHGDTRDTPAADLTTEIIEPVNGTLFTRQDEIVVRVRIPVGSRAELFANGVVVPPKQIGQKVVHVAEKVEEVTYFGVVLARGWNAITLRAETVSGQVLEDSATVALAGRPRELRAEEERVLVPADGIETRQIRFTVLDQYGLRVIDGMAGTVVEGDTLLVNTDARPDLPGFQVATRDGYFHVLLKSSRHTGRRRVVVAMDGLKASSEVAYVPRSRPAFVSGIFQATLGAFDASGEADPLGLEDFDDGVSLDGDARLFAQGTGRGGINLTARMDTKKQYDDPLLKTMNPDEGYPVYGDQSEVLYAAPAQGGNYVALEKGESFLRYGDFRSPLTQGEFLAYKRATTGMSAALVSGPDGVRAFFAESDFTTVQDEVPGDGTSGFYYLTRTPVVENSITIVLQTRDRFQSEKILDIQPMVQFRDYTVNYFNGAILFKAPVPVTDDRMNPITIVANYETKSNEEAQYLYGFRGDIARFESFNVGAQAVGRGRNGLNYALYGVEGGVTLAGLGLSGEVARSEDDVVGDANAYKVLASYQNAGNSASAYYRRVDEKFTNPSFAGGQTERFTKKAGFDAHAKVSRDFAVEANGYHQNLERTDETQTNLAAIGVFEKRGLSFGAGARAATEETPTADKRSLLSIAGFGARRSNGAELRAHWEHNLKDDVVQQYPDRITSLLTIPVRRNLKVVTTYEYRTTHGQPAAHQFLSGIEAQLRPGSVAYTKYSMNRTASDDRMGAVSGLKQSFRLTDKTTGLLNVEGLLAFDGSTDDEYLALKTGVNRLNRGISLIEGQYEYRWQTSSSRHLFNVIAARELNDGLTLLFKDAVSLTLPDATSNAIHSEGRLAGAYRPDVSPVRTLLMVRSLYDRFSPVDPLAITWRLVFSTDVNIVPAPPHEIRLKLAVKRMEDYSFGISETTNNYLFLSQYVYRFAKAWDVDLWGRFLGQGAVGTRQFGAGVEVGRLFFSQVRVSAGYSVNGFEERDMSENDAWAKGFGLRVQYILSDWIFNELGL